MNEAIHCSNSSWTVTVPKSIRDDDNPIGHCCKDARTACYDAIEVVMIIMEMYLIMMMIIVVMVMMILVIIIIRLTVKYIVLT